MDDLLSRIKSIMEIIFLLGLIILIILITHYVIKYSKNIEYKPYDDLKTHLETIDCKDNWCNITFDSDIERFYQVPETGSMVPLIGGNDWVVCLDTDGEDLSLGEYVITPYALHMIYEKDGKWYITKGFNNPTVDPYKVSEENIRCVIGAVLR